jgi:hypothetical protein
VPSYRRYTRIPIPGTRGRVPRRKESFIHSNLLFVGTSGLGIGTTFQEVALAAVPVRRIRFPRGRRPPLGGQGREG